MVSATAERNPCAPAEPRVERIDTGTLVRLRCVPKAGPFTVLAIITIERHGGAVATRYELAYAAEFSGIREASFFADAANVTVHQGDNPDAIFAEGYPATEPPDLADLINPDTRIRWVQNAATERTSADGRFQISAVNGPSFTARDFWTGEEATGLPTEFDAMQWCRRRTDATKLAWRNRGYGYTATRDGETYSVHFGHNHRYFGADERFADEARRLSPWFDTPDQAREWCEVRATCSVTADPAGIGAPQLRYEQPIPF